MMAPAMTAPPMTPAAIPGPQPHPRPRHWAEASVAVAATITTIVAAPSKLTMVFFIDVSLGAPIHCTRCNANTRPLLSSMTVCSCVRGGALDRGPATGGAQRSRHSTAQSRHSVLLGAVRRLARALFGPGGCTLGLGALCGLPARRLAPWRLRPCPRRCQQQ
jgi:hypothetical protein